MPRIPTYMREIPERKVFELGRASSSWGLNWVEARWLMAHHIVAAGVTRAGPGYAVCQRNGQIGTVVACLGGAGWATVDGAAQPFTRGSAYLMPAGDWTAYWVERTPWTLAWVCFTEGPPRPLAVPGSSAVVPGDGTTLAGLLDALRREAEGKRDQAAIGHLCALVDLASKRLAGVDRGPDPLDAAWRAIESDLARPWRLGDLARLAGCGVESLRLACVRSTGRSPMAQVAYLRMRRAAILLADPQARVSTVAEQVGYGSPFAFSIAFKRWMNMAPSTYQGRRIGETVVG